MKNDFRIPEDHLINHLNAGERLLWSAQPRQGVRFLMVDIFLIPFSLLWGGATIFITSKMISSGVPLLFKIWMIPFLMVGVYLMIGRFFYDAYRRKKTFYGLSIDRIIVKTGVFKQSIYSYDLKSISNVSVKEKPDGSGTILLGPKNGLLGLDFGNYFRGSGWPSTRNRITPGIEEISEARKVYKEIMALIK